ncbi:hypothetical protein [Riemerella columbina]|uniref:hypothetical protein n=1 Tax=Riemerella columbina TaxID=103810 RepID=UPI00266F6391|nr:hypothetical protein [Riemerella columbina]WKS94743.1 hypothetical protein NYR17_07355 [Riemerella columbina]
MIYRISKKFHISPYYKRWLYGLSFSILILFAKISYDATTNYLPEHLPQNQKEEIYKKYPVVLSTSDIKVYQNTETESVYVVYKKPPLAQRSPEFKVHTQKWFDFVMYGLIDLSQFTGISYTSINILIYCILVPLFLGLSFWANRKFFKYFKERKNKSNKK